MIYLILIVFNLIIFLIYPKISKIININDYPDGKLKLHNHKIPLLGGPVIFSNLILILFLQLYFFDNVLIFQEISNLKIEIVSTVIFIISFFFIGLYDDKYKVSPFIKLFLIILFSFILLHVNQDLIVQNFSLSFYENRIFFHNFSIFFTIFCIVILINALNFYDGINGQSSSIYIFVFAYLYYVSNFNYFYLILILILFFVLFLNLLNKLFLGDSGIYLITSILIVSIIYEYNSTKNIVYADEIFYLFLLPGLDLVRLTIERLITNKNIFYGDRKHFHHYLVKKHNLLISNFLLLILNLIPISLFYLDVNFYYILIFFLVTYFIILFSLKKFNKYKL